MKSGCRKGTPTNKYKTFQNNGNKPLLKDLGTKTRISPRYHIQARILSVKCFVYWPLSLPKKLSNAMSPQQEIDTICPMKKVWKSKI